MLTVAVAILLEPGRRFNTSTSSDISKGCADFDIPRYVRFLSQMQLTENGKALCG